MKVSECSGSTLAYLGDAVFSLLVREYLIEKGYGRAKDLQRESIRYVSAKAQAHFFHTLENEGFFTEDELEIYRRGRNFKSTSIPKNTDVQTYRTSTGIEAVIGYWHLEKKETRLEQFWDKIKTIMEE